MSSFQNDQAIAKSLAPREGCRELMKGEITDSLPDRIMRIMGSVLRVGRDGRPLDLLKLEDVCRAVAVLDDRFLWCSQPYPSFCDRR